MTMMSSNNSYLPNAGSQGVVGLLIAAGAIKATPAHRGSVCGTLYLNLRDSNLPLGIARDVDVDLCLFLILNLAGDVDADESGGQAARDLSACRLVTAASGQSLSQLHMAASQHPSIEVRLDAPCFTCSILWAYVSASSEPFDSGPFDSGGSYVILFGASFSLLRIGWHFVGNLSGFLLRYPFIHLPHLFVVLTAVVN
ncbi:GM14801 [Drosophila sechellia]|uniref:GM14801 n=1 Tax=Drosophila sechellia TaxID=7238 RepID=B4HUY4_DROSE|nr:GM14801 [Drosophila sechellia]